MTGKHFELTDETRNYFGHNLHRIRATRDMTRYCVRKGDVGGWVECERNVSGYAWVSGDARVFGDASVSDNAEISGNAEVSSNARVSGNAEVSGDARVHGDARVYGDAEVYGNANVYGNADVSGDATVHGEARIFGDAEVEGNASVYGNADVSGDARVSGRAEVHGRATVTERQDILVVYPIGSQSVTATLTRTAAGHNLSVGCWHGGTIYTLRAEVDRRSQTWPGTAQDHARWRAEHEALEALCRARIAGWKRMDEDPATDCPV
ncbi:polymer-forming cytoskeletal protein [Rhodococcus maanshanensis]|uniref:polymer-forming cytoskeletal protein n=1 Tax=Rhodococcus maanshanensis TaxID=183556 RepID=UPI0022B2CDF6|nr:polymer-forming cytoskeletal protein [Rhodococcus maanshanensis]MCZ4555802.1 polymer-forming cytoskeletal protein [Rhodococcus maanshanensis]